MRVNWDKTDGMYIGSNVARPPTPEVTRQHADGTSTTISFAEKIYNHAPGAHPGAYRLQYHTRLRYLGVIIGTSLPADHNWHMIKSNIENTITNRLTYETTDVGKVINCNPCVIGAANYVLSHAGDTTDAATLQLDRMAKRAVSGRCPILDPQVLMMQPKQGNPVPRLHTQRHVNALIATPMYNLIKHGPTTDYHHYWLRALHHLAVHLNLYSTDHLFRIEPPHIRYTPHMSVHYQVYQAFMACRRLQSATIALPQND